MKWLALFLFPSCFMLAQQPGTKVMLTYPNPGDQKGKSVKQIDFLKGTYAADFADKDVLMVADSTMLINKVYYLMNDPDPTIYSGTVQRYLNASKQSFYIINHNKADGTVALSVTYNSEGQKDGFYDAYHASGFREESGRYYRGKKDGRWVYYDSLGRLVKSERYFNGQREKLKEYKDPSRNRYAKSLKDFVIPYRIRNAGDTSLVEWNLKEKDYFPVFGLSLGAGFFLNEGLSNDSMPGMLGFPNGNEITISQGMQIGNPGKIFLDAEFILALHRNKTGQYNGEDVKANYLIYQYHVSVGKALYTFGQGSTGLFAGITYADANFSAQNLTNSTGGSYEWVELSSLRQHAMIRVAAYFHLRSKVRRKWANGLFIRAGYNYAYENGFWHYLGSALNNRQDANLGGAFISLSLQASALRKYLR